MVLWNFSAACTAARFVAKEQTGCLSTACTAAHLTTKPVTVLSIFSAACMAAHLTTKPVTVLSFFSAVYTAALSIKQAELLVLEGYGSLQTDIKSQMPKNF